MENLITFGISTITGIITYFFGVRKARKEVEGMALTNVEKSLTIYNKIIEDLSAQVDELLKKVQILEDKIDELKSENESLKDMLKDRNNSTKSKSNANS